MKLYLADKPVKAGALVAVVCNEFPGSRVHTLIVRHGEEGERYITLDDGPLREHGPKPGDMVIDHGDTVSWMSPDAFNEAYAAVPE